MRAPTVAASTTAASTTAASLLVVLLLLPLLNGCNGIEPVTVGLGIGAIVGSYYLNRAWDTIKCPVTECCGRPWLKQNATELEDLLDRNVFGQHLVRTIVTRAIRSHIRKQEPKKALVLSFHGWTGAGKNYVAKFVADSLFAKGLRSNHVRLFISTLHFPHEEEADIYRLQLQDWIRGNVSACPQTLFIFDEMDKLPEGVIDAIKPFIDHHESVMGVDFRRAIFLFLSNTGGVQITHKLLEVWREGERRREELTYADFEELVNLGAFNERGGLYHSTVIEKSLVDHFVPFLPLERSHVKKCIEAEAAERNRTLAVAHVDSIADDMTYWPSDLRVFSTTGCKRVAQKVDLLVEELEEQDKAAEEEEARWRAEKSRTEGDDDEAARWTRARPASTATP